LNRTTRSVSLTDAGVRLLERLRPAFDQITNAMEDLNEVRGRPVGNLRVYVSSTAAADVVAPIWKCFLSTYPEVNLEVEVGETPIDIVAKRFDAGIGPRNRSAIDMIVSNGRLFEWMFERNGKSTTLAVNGRVIVNSCELALRAAADGLGLAYVIESDAAPLLRSGELVRVLEEWSPAAEGLYLHHPSHRQMLAALRALIEMLQAARRTRH
jgi:DNA-binding transcriptional LysR family regulator